MAASGGQKSAECYVKRNFRGSGKGVTLEIRKAWQSGGGDRDAEDSEDGAGSNGSWDDGTDTGDTQVGK